MEILLVVGIIAILAGIVIVAINPSKQLATVRNTERKSDIKQIDSAILQYYIDNFRYPAGITGDLKGICNTGSLSTTSGSGIVCGTLVDLTSLVPTYITSIPTDPQSTTTNTGYYVKEDATTHKIGTRAWLAELEQDININAASGTVAQEEGSTLGVDLVAHYKMNDANCDNVDDTQGNDGTGTCTGNQSGATANTGTSMSFNGSGDYVSISHFNNYSVNTEITVSAWIYLNNSDYQSFVNEYDDYPVNMAWFLEMSYLNPGKGRFMLSPNGTDLPGTADATTASDLPIGEWFHLAATYDGHTNIIYLNGNPDGSVVEDNALVLNNQGTINIGKSWASTLNGKIDDVRIYSRVLEQSEITALAAGTEAE